MYDRRIIWSAAFLLSAVTFAAIAASGQWVCFDPTFPQDFIDTRSIVHVDKRVVRFWERAGAYPDGDGPDPKFPTYTLTEFNCATHMYRGLRWEMALEGGNNAAALGARAKFLKETAEIQKMYPGDWESMDPSPHSYSRLDFVCAPKS